MEATCRRNLSGGRGGDEDSSIGVGRDIPLEVEVEAGLALRHIDVGFCSCAVVLL